MAKGKELGLGRGDIVIAAHARMVNNAPERKVSSGIPLVPNHSWNVSARSVAGHDYDVDTEAHYTVLVGEVLRSPKKNNRVEFRILEATDTDPTHIMNDRHYPGETHSIKLAQDVFVGGKDEPTRAALEESGVYMYPIFDVSDKSSDRVAGVFVHKTWDKLPHKVADEIKRGI